MGSFNCRRWKVLIVANGIFNCRWTPDSTATGGSSPAPIASSSQTGKQTEIKTEASHSGTEEPPAYSVGYPAGWNRITQKACPVGRLADFSFQIKDEFPVIESENQLVCFAPGGPVVGKSHQLFKDCIYQFTTPSGVLITIKILDIDQIARLIKFACTSAK